jgi:tetratricopeptide (TPR) repeat protein
MNARRIIVMFLVAAMLIGATYLVTSTRPGPTPPGQVSLGLEDSFSVSHVKSTDELIDYWGARFKGNPQDFISLTYLGQTYMSKARETGDIANYVSAESAFRKALAIDPKYENAQGYLSAVLFAKHDFHGALAQANYVYAYDPHALLVLGTIGDAQMELGNYSQAETAFQTLLDRAPGPAVYARLSRLDWLQGYPEGALQWMQRAVDEATQAGYTGEEAAWYEFQLGELYFNVGRPEDAETHYSAALSYFDNYYLALIGLGKVRAAQNRLTEAITYYERAVAIIPQPEYLAALGDLYAVTGQSAKAQREYDTVEFIGKLAAINQVIYNRQLALFYGNHDRKLTEALDLAGNELAVRKDLYGYDAYAWTLFKNGRYSDAAEGIGQALKLGTRDALLYYHAGMIYAALGDSPRAEAFLNEALFINPHFDLLQSRIATAKLEQLRSQANASPGRARRLDPAIVLN